MKPFHSKRGRVYGGHTLGYCTFIFSLFQNKMRRLQDAVVLELTTTKTASRLRHALVVELCTEK